MKKFLFFPVVLAATIVVMSGLTGCQTLPPSQTQASDKQLADTNSVQIVNLREGDVLKISFPGSPTLDTTEQVRRDGKITLPLVGEVEAAGMTPSALQNKLMDLYAPQLVTKQVVVELATSSFPIYITGMVVHPGEILSDRPITALEAIMQAGGPDYDKANLKGVIVIRREGNIMKHYTLNLQSVLDGKQSQPFYLEPDDIVYLPERFTMF